MPEVSYVPGALTAVAGGGCLALIEASPDSPVVARIWAQVGLGARPDTVLGGLIADGLASVPGFVMLATGEDGTPRLFCRGAVGATVYPGDAANGETPASATLGRIDGAGLLTWREQVVGPDVRRIVLGEPPDGGALRLPAASGVLLAGCVIVDLAGPAVSGTLPGGPVSGGTAVSPPVMSGTAFSGAAFSGTAPQGGEDSEDIVKTIVLDAGAQHAPPPMVQGTVLNDTVNQDEVLRDTVTDAPAAGPPAPAMAGPPAAAVAGPPAAALAGTNPPGSPAGYPDTITMTTPGSMASHGPASPAPGAPQPWQAPLPQMPAPARAPATPPGVPGPANPPGALIDVPPWLAASGAPTPAGGMPAWAPQPPQSQWGEGGQGPGESGATLQRADLAGLVTGPPDRIGPVVPALICPAGHLNPPSGAACRRCGAPLPHDPVPVPRPVLGVLRLSLGGVITLDRGVIMGRNPRADFAGPDGEERPHVVRLPSADGDISRNHVRVDLDGWHVLVTDLNSTNGTLVTLPGRDPQQLRPGEPVPIQPNTVVTLADGIDFRYEVTE